MKRWDFLPSTVGLLTAVCGALMPAHAAAEKLSSDRFDLLDSRGVFTPDFKVAIHALVDTRQAVAQAQAETKKLTANMPKLKEQAAQDTAQAVALRQELARYEHPDETDFVALQALMRDNTAKPEDQIVSAQAYVWAYATSPHQAEAQQYLQQVQKQISTQQQARKDAEADRQAARARLVQRAHDHDLSLGEWRDFLRDMSQDDLVKNLGRPNSETSDYWIYSGPWTVDAVTNQRVGLQINFNAGRVLSVSEAPHVPAP
jgi:hypothetical protein